jgi:hypothetical protein
MNYTVKIVMRDGDISEREKADRVAQFNHAFVTAAVNYYAGLKSTGESGRVS